ncbi:MAG: hypothetical protein LBJ44_08190 [Propionibacteriaceae bacterium]|jgi:hypothetical protein|nr:hypothetical protein [Propionibacteriaceae bacterium]
MGRLFWFGLGVTVGAVVVLRGRRLLERATPQSLVGQAGRAGAALVQRAGQGLTVFAQARREAELELRQRAGLA